MEDRRRSITAKINPSAIHRATVEAYVSNHCMGFSWAPRALGFVRNRDWERLLSLSEEIDLQIGQELTHDETCHTEYGSAASMLVASQFVALIGKYQFSRVETPSFDPDAKALEDFFKCERRNKRLNDIFMAHLRRGTERHWCIPLVRDVFCRVLGKTPFYERIFDRCDFSGGASVLTKGQRTALPFKIGAAGRISGSKRAFAHFKLALWRNAHYRELFLEARNGFVCYDRSEFDRMLDLLFEEADYNILSVVPKKAKSGRTIAKEPEVQNFLQKGVDLEMRALLARFLNVDLTNQEVNGIMALEGSVCESDPYVTLDVKGASNSQLTGLIQSVTPPRWFRLLDDLRSHSFRVQGSTENIPYSLFTSMGNGFCFPLESLLFAAIVIAASKHCGAPCDFRVYGDDIICRQSIALVVMECLNACGFQLNREKSHLFGPFRESCGANWYNGQDVTPGYYKDRVQTRTEVYALHNTLRDYPEVARVVRSFVHKPHLVPEDKMYAYVSNQACIVAQDVALCGPRTYYDRDIGRCRYPVLVPVPQIVAPSEYLAGLFSSVTRDWEEVLVAIAVIRGSTSDSPYHYRDNVKYYDERAVVPRVPRMSAEDEQWFKAQAALHNHVRTVTHKSRQPRLKMLGGV